MALNLPSSTQKPVSDLLPEINTSICLNSKASTNDQLLLPQSYTTLTFCLTFPASSYPLFSKENKDTIYGIYFLFIAQCLLHTLDSFPDHLTLLYSQQFFTVEFSTCLHLLQNNSLIQINLSGSYLCLSHKLYMADY